MIQVRVRGLDGSPIEDAFLVDVGADRTVLSGHFFTGLRLPSRLPDTGMMLEGISGKCTFVWINAPLELISILGRDVLNNFDVSSAGRAMRSCC